MIKRLQSRVGQLFLRLLLGIALSLLCNGCGEPKTYKIGVLAGLNLFAAVTDGFKAKLTELGYIQGKNISYVVKRSNFNIKEYRSAAKQFVADKVDLILVFPTEASMEVKQATRRTNIPVVFAAANIEETGLIHNIPEPGGNMTGVRYPGPDLALKRFEIMHEMAPKARRYWIPYQKGYPIVNSQLKVLKPVAIAAGITLIEAPASNAAELEAAFQAQLKSGGLDAILLIAEPLAVTPENFTTIGKLAVEHKIPWGGAYMEVGDYKTIFGVSINSFKTGEQAAVIADKILRGAKAGVIRVDSSESYFEISYKTAKEFGVNVSESLLNQANKVIR